MKNDFNYCIEIDYNYKYGCNYYDNEETNFCDDDICRCGRIVNTEIVSIDINNLVNNIKQNYKSTTKDGIREEKIKSILIGFDMTDYIINRILTINKAWDKELYTIEIFGGYYGEEIDSVQMDCGVFNKIINSIEHALSLSSIKDIQLYLLELEYDDILEKLLDKEFEVEYVNKKDIIFPAENHKNNVDKKDLSHYSDDKYNTIRGLVLKCGDKWKVIDGYHRLSETKLDEVLVITAK
jgi:hypothetical protein